MGILASLIRAATPENPRFNLNDPAAWDGLLDGEPSASGEQVNAKRALSYSPWWRGVTLLSRDCGKLPCHVYQRIENDLGEGKKRDTEHPAYYLIRWKPNDWQTALDFREQLTGHAAGVGNGYAYINRARIGRPIELLPLDPQRTYPVRENGKLWYVNEVGASQRKLPPEDVLHIHGFSSDGICGLSIVDYARESLGLGIGHQRYAATALKNSGRPAVVLEHPAEMTDDAKIKLRETWERMHTGIDNAHRTAILDRGLKANVLGFSSEDLQAVQQRKVTVRDVANFFGLPPHKLGDDALTGYNSLEQENQAYLDDGLDYWLCKWESQYREKLLTDDEKTKDTHFVEFMRAALVRADLAARSAYYRTALAGQPWMTQDEVRAGENLDPQGGEAGKLQKPLNMGQGGGQNAPNDPAAPPPGRPKRQRNEP